ncbi:hypothetical protein L2E82_47086 [Cichorium intybus]|uniref:Uncharacterized protein n=1 Tax=Cichorium intybus TaxID=13427 RepID=A0ACB8YTT1_CICIN|nr:hypothetical protein L2E82_47086 [Cichorium intybus]
MASSSAFTQITQTLHHGLKLKHLLKASPEGLLQFPLIEQHISMIHLQKNTNKTGNGALSKHWTPQASKPNPWGQLGNGGRGNGPVRSPNNTWAAQMGGRRDGASNYNYNPPSNTIPPPLQTGWNWNVSPPKCMSIGNQPTPVVPEVVQEDVKDHNIFQLNKKFNNINDPWWMLRSKEVPKGEKELDPQDNLTCTLAKMERLDRFALKKLLFHLRDEKLEEMKEFEEEREKLIKLHEIA